jgi:hypothetical protein
MPGRTERLAMLLTIAVSGGSCAGPYRTQAPGWLEARALLRVQQTGRVQTSTRAYREVVARSLASHCRMFPSDSELYDLRAARCGAAPAALLGVSRLLLEVEASPAFLPVVAGGPRVRWLDLPPSAACRP